MSKVREASTNRTGLSISSLEPNLERKTGLRVGDRILQVNGESVQDELDYRFFSSGDRVDLIVRSSPGTGFRSLALTRDEAEGIGFDPMRSMRCRNRCVFCFVDQLPSGLRKTLYVKDEDDRFSFLYGNYVTLASIKDSELERIRCLRLSPLYVSVHATHPHVRNFLLGRRASRDILETVRRLAEGGIIMHTQVVLCPGINDGEILRKTIFDLVRHHPFVASIAVVPVGQTRFRKEQSLYPIKRIDKRYSENIINEISKIRETIQEETNGNILYLSDEFYWKSQQPFPALQEYNDFPQWENGVGMVPLFNRQWKRHRRRPANPGRGLSPRFVAVTGEMAYPYLVPYVNELKERMGIRLKLLPVLNRYLGRQVTVTGLITGKDLIRQLKSKLKPGTVLLIPDVMLVRQKGRFLDDVSLEDIQETLDVSVDIFSPNPTGFEKTLERYTSKFKRNN